MVVIDDIGVFGVDGVVTDFGAREDGVEGVFGASPLVGCCQGGTFSTAEAGVEFVEDSELVRPVRTPLVVVLVTAVDDCKESDRLNDGETAVGFGLTTAVASFGREGGRPGGSGGGGIAAMAEITLLLLMPVGFLRMLCRGEVGVP